MLQGPSRIRWCECFARDGLQNLPLIVPSRAKIEMIDRFIAAGAPLVEATSFSHPGYLPQFADAEAVLKGLSRRPGTKLVGLVPNEKGLDRALALGEAGHGVDAVIVIVSASESYNRKNVNRSVEETMEAMDALVPRAGRAGLYVIASISTAFGCHIEGRVPLARVEALARRFRDRGADEIMLGDTTGMANPRQVGEGFAHLFDKVPGVTLTAHFHDTRGAAAANALAAWQAGVERFDGSLGGIGGRAHGLVEGAEARFTGNVASEDLLALFEQMGVATGIDLPRYLEAARRAEQLLAQPLFGHVADTGLVRWDG